MIRSITDSTTLNNGLNMPWLMQPRGIGQIVLRWNPQDEVVTIPKYSRPARVEENAEIYDFTLSVDDMRALDALNQNKRLGPEPADFNSWAPFLSASWNGVGRQSFLRGQS